MNLLKEKLREAVDLAFILGVLSLFSLPSIIVSSLRRHVLAVIGVVLIILACMRAFQV